MTDRINHALEAHPFLGFLGSLFSILTGAASWFMDHADDFTKLIGLVATLFGLVAGYYTMRIQRRSWLSRKRHD